MKKKNIKKIVILFSTLFVLFLTVLGYSKVTHAATVDLTQESVLSNDYVNLRNKNKELSFSEDLSQEIEINGDELYRRFVGAIPIATGAIKKSINIKLSFDTSVCSYSWSEKNQDYQVEYLIFFSDEYIESEKIYFEFFLEDSDFTISDTINYSQNFCSKRTDNDVYFKITSNDIISLENYAKYKYFYIYSVIATDEKLITSEDTDLLIKNEITSIDFDVVDEEAPEINCVYDELCINNNLYFKKSSLPTLTDILECFQAFDNVYGFIEVKDYYSNYNDSLFIEDEEYLITLYVTDAAGNISEATYYINIIDDLKYSYLECDCSLNEILTLIEGLSLENKYFVYNSTDDVYEINYKDYINDFQKGEIIKYLENIIVNKLSSYDNSISYRIINETDDNSVLASEYVFELSGYLFNEATSTFIVLSDAPIKFVFNSNVETVTDHDTALSNNLFEALSLEYIKYDVENKRYIVDYELYQNNYAIEDLIENLKGLIFYTMLGRDSSEEIASNLFSVSCSDNFGIRTSTATITLNNISYVYNNTLYDLSFSVDFIIGDLYDIIIEFEREGVILDLPDGEVTEEQVIEWFGISSPHYKVTFDIPYTFAIKGYKTYSFVIYGRTESQVSDRYTFTIFNTNLQAPELESGVSKIYKSLSGTLSSSEIIAMCKFVDDYDSTVTVELLSDTFTDNGNKIGTYQVVIKASDSFNNAIEHTVNIEVVNTLPKGVTVFDRSLITTNESNPLEYKDFDAIFKTIGVISNVLGSTYEATYKSDYFDFQEVYGEHSFDYSIKESTGATCSGTLTIRSLKSPSSVGENPTPGSNLFMKIINQIVNFFKFISKKIADFFRKIF